jgi:hypothetical protein
MKYRVTGQAGSGKSSVAAELGRRGFIAYDTDAIPGVTGFDYADTGLPVPRGSGEITHPIDFARSLGTDVSTRCTSSSRAPKTFSSAVSPRTRFNSGACSMSCTS